MCIRDRLYWGRFDPELGATVDTFFDAFREMFVFLESGDNWDAVVLNAYGVSKWGALVFIPLSVLGAFFLLSMVLALFDSSYEERKESQVANTRARYRLALVSSFQLLCRKQLREGSTKDINDQGPGFILTKQSFVQLVGALDINSPFICNFIFDLMDVNESGTIDMLEYEKLLFVCRCCNLLVRDRLLMHKVVVARAELLVGESTAFIDAMPASAQFDDTRRQAEESLAEHCVQRAEAQQQLDEYYEEVLESLLLFGWLPMLWLDRLGMGMLLVHCWVLSFNSTEHDTVHIVSSCFNLVYCVEVALRVDALGGLTGFFADPRGGAYVVQNKVALVTTAIGLFGAVMALIEGSVSTGYGRVWEALQVLPLWRVFVMHKDFREIVNSFTSGLKAVGTFCILLAVVFYVWCVVAHMAFKDIAPVGAFSNELNFNTLGDTCLAMYQVFIGAGWSGITRAVVLEKYQAYDWFFLVYRLVLGVLFSNLVVGVLIGTFGQFEEGRRTVVGEVRLAFEAFAKILLPAQQQKLQQELGVVAQELLQRGDERHLFRLGEDNPLALNAAPELGHTEPASADSGPDAFLKGYSVTTDQARAVIKELRARRERGEIDEAEYQSQKQLLRSADLIYANGQGFSDANVSMLKELRAQRARGDIDDAEYRVKKQKLRTQNQGRGTMADDVPAGETGDMPKKGSGDECVDL
eukprot:TRINITY_DN8131_c0_g1_i3.p1 TRINITY_DN8131_c0_g1~~TRINITY_DN8131_c0_g1_i3.p1  ORF type:complete len:695 (-),score=193.98 TRINITY_DN8131_c0_g1_i3:300-2384(-)